MLISDLLDVSSPCGGKHQCFEVACLLGNTPAEENSLGAVSDWHLVTQLCWESDCNLS